MRKLTTLTIIFVTLIFTATSISCTDDIKADIKDLQGQTTDLDAQLAAFKVAQADVQRQNEQQQKALEDAISALKKEEIEARQKDVADLTATDIRLQDAIDNLKNKDVAEIKGQIAGLNGRTTAIEDKLPKLDNKLDSLSFEVSRAQTLAKWDSTQIVALKNQYDTLARNVSELQVWAEGKVSLLTEALNDINIEIARVNDLANEAKALANQAFTLAQTTNSTLSDAIKQLETDINLLLQKLDSKYANALLNQVTGVILQGTDDEENRMTLTVNFGEATKSLVFPDDALDEEDLQQLDESQKGQLKLVGGQPLIGEVGNIYLTINPNTVNFEGVEANDTTGIVLEDSRGNESGLTLGKVKKSDKLLKISRGVQNGFYEIPVSVSEENLDKLKSHDNSTAYAAKVYWKNVNGRQQAVYSQYDLQILTNEGSAIDSLHLDTLTFDISAYSGERRVPVYRTFWAVTDVYSADDMTKHAQGGDETCLSVLRESNKNGISAKNYRYKIVVAALDYHGRSISKIIYINL